MPRINLIVEFDGTPFSGWQRQINSLSVQQVLEEAASALDENPVVAAAAGRTDTGVHAIAMSVHIDLQKDLPADNIRDALNYHIRPHPVSVLKAEKVPDTFHARFSCLRRHYIYRLISRRAPLALDKNRLWRLPYELDVDGMRAAAGFLTGKHDFTTFRSTQCQAKSPIKTLDAITVERTDDCLTIRCNAPSFLHNQVRSIVGTLERVGASKWTPDDVRDALEARDRAACGPVAPAHGLYFARADYPEIL